MSHPSIELQVEVELFERLERRAQLTLGQLTALRRQARQEQRNLLFVTYEAGLVDDAVADELARALHLDLARAPWVIAPPRPRGYVPLQQRRAERSLSEGEHAPDAGAAGAAGAAGGGAAPSLERR